MAATDDAKSYYGYLFEANKQPTKLLDALLRGIAIYISENIGDTTEKWLKPDKMAAFYRAVGGNYDSLFVEIPPLSISWIYASIGCQHVLLPTTDLYVPPSIPSLTIAGFVRWQSIEILLGPEEHVPFIKESLRLFDIRHPETNERFPVDLPMDSFPLVPDPEIERWHENCAKLLRLRTRTKEEERSCSPSKPKVQRTEFSREDTRQKEGVPLRPQSFGRSDRKNRSRPTTPRFSINENPGTSSNLDDPELDKIVVELEPPNSRKSRHEYPRRHSLPSRVKEKKGRKSVINRNESDDASSTELGIPNRTSKSFYSHYAHNHDDDIFSKIAHSASHYKAKMESKPSARSARPVRYTKYVSSDLSKQDSEVDKFRTRTYKQNRNGSPETTDYECERRRFDGIHGGSTRRRHAAPVVTVSDEFLSRDFRDRDMGRNRDKDMGSVRRRGGNTQQEWDIDPNSSGGRKLGSDEKTRRERKQMWESSSPGLSYKSRETSRLHSDFPKSFKVRHMSPVRCGVHGRYFSVSH